MINDNFSLMQGGLVYKMLAAMGALKHGKRTTPVVAALIVGISFLPLVLLSYPSGALQPNDVRVSLLGDYEVLSRFLVAMPLLVLAAPRSDALLRSAIRQLVQSGAVRTDHQASLDRILDRIRQFRDSNAPELLCVALALLPLLFPTQHSLGLLPGVADWRIEQPGSPSPAGRWFDLVSTPLFRFVALIWLWRFCLWTYLLWHLSRIDLKLHPAHPDGAGGIGFLGLAQERFAVLALAGGFLLCGACINHVVYASEAVSSMRHLVIGYIAGATLLLAAPLLLLSPAMLKAKRKALLKYNTIGNHMVHTFDARWSRGQTTGDDSLLLDKSDASALQDFSGVYVTLASMSLTPLSRWNLLWIALHAAAPMIPLAFFAMSVDELARKLFSILV